FCVWKKLTDKKLPKVSDYTSYDLKKAAGKIYRFKIEFDNKTKQFKAKYMMDIHDLYKYSAKKWKDRLNNIKKDLKVKREVIENEAEVIRKARISGFGIKNFDLPKDAPKQKVLASFQLDEPIKNKNNRLNKIFMIPGDNSSVYTKELGKDKTKIELLKGEENVRLFAILPDKTIAMYPVEKFKKLDLIKGKPTKDTPTHEFTLEKQEAPISNKNDMRELLGMVN
ncbi:MAG: hypothetical protein ABEH43_04055, partial [Flavobacteriales bacterium]